MKSRKVNPQYVNDHKVTVKVPDSPATMVSQIANWLKEENAVAYASKQGAYLIEKDTLGFLAVIQGIWVYLFKLDLVSKLGIKYSEYPFIEDLGRDLSKHGYGNVDTSIIHDFREKDCYRALAKALGQSLCRGNATAERLQVEFEAILSLPREEVACSIRKYLDLLVNPQTGGKEDRKMPRSKQQVAGLQEWLDLRNAIWKRCGVDARENKKVLRVKAFEILGLEDDGTLDSMALVSLLLEPQIEHISAVVEDDYIGPATLAAMRMAEEEQLISSIAPIEQPLHVDPWENHGLEVHKFVYELVDEVNNLWRSWHRSSIAMFKSGLNARIEQLPDSLKMPYLNFLSGLLGAYHQDEDVAWSDLEKTVLEYKHLVFSEMFNSWK